MCLHIWVHVCRCVGSCMKAQPWVQGRASSLGSHCSKLMSSELPPKCPSACGSVLGVRVLCTDHCPGPMTGKKDLEKSCSEIYLDSSWNLSVTHFLRQHEPDLPTFQTKSFWSCAGSCPSTTSSLLLAWTIKDSTPLYSLNLSTVGSPVALFWLTLQTHWQWASTGLDEAGAGSEQQSPFQGQCWFKPLSPWWQ